MDPLVSLILFISSLFIIYFIYRELRRRALINKYGDAALVSRLMRRMFWEGQTAGQLIDSLGKPREIDRKVLKSKTRETWKYNQNSKKRFGLRITLENDVVVGWDKKGG